MKRKRTALCISVIALGLICGLREQATALDYELGIGLSRFSYSPNLPRDVIQHETHPDDRVFMPGDAGTTELDTVDITTLNLRAGIVSRVYRMKYRFHLQYTARIPIQEDGREQKQNENDSRPKSQGSFIYTEVDSMDIAHELGVGFSWSGDAGLGLFFEVRPMLHLGYWSVSYQKGWDRFGRDEASYVTNADGMSIYPELNLLVGTEKHRAGLAIGYRAIDFDYDTPPQGSSSATGIEIGASYIYTF